MRTAVIFAAGRGERLRPITDRKPKCMCEVHGVPLIGHHLEQLRQAGFQNVIINHAYLGDQIRQYVRDGSRWNLDILFSPEPTGGLETGGTIIDILPWLGNEPFITISADVYTKYPLQQLRELPMDGAHIVLIPKLPYAARSDFGLTATHFVTNENAAYTFANIACFMPELFRDLKPGRYSITPFIRSLAERKLLTGEVYEGTWVDIGTPERLAAVNQNFSRRLGFGPTKCFSI